MTHRFTLYVITLIGLIVVILGWSLTAGAVSIRPAVVMNTLFNLDGPQQDFIVNRSRLPRSLLAIVTGGALGLAGAIIQSVLRNPLASPKIMGVTSGAAVAVLMSGAMAPQLNPALLPLAAGLGGACAAAFVYGASVVRTASPARLVLVGLAVAMTCDAIVDFILVTADSYAISSPLIWLTGSLWSRGWTHLGAVAPALMSLACLSLVLAHRLDIMHLGHSQARSLGAHVARERLMLLGLAVLLASVSVSVVGVLGFVGLMAPHIARALVGGTNKRLLPVAMLIGALLVLTADAAGRALFAPLEVSAGILTALFGAPFFIYLLLRGSR